MEIEETIQSLWVAINDIEKMLCQQEDSDEQTGIPSREALQQ